MNTVMNFRTEHSVIFGYAIAQLIDHDKTYTCTEIRDLLRTVGLDYSIQRIVWNLKLLCANGLARRIEVEIAPFVSEFRGHITIHRCFQARFIFD